jgi:hypothetical protein
MFSAFEREDAVLEATCFLVEREIDLPASGIEYRHKAAGR